MSYLLTCYFLWCVFTDFATRAETHEAEAFKLPAEVDYGGTGLEGRVYNHNHNHGCCMYRTRAEHGAEYITITITITIDVCMTRGGAGRCERGGRVSPST